MARAGQAHDTPLPLARLCPVLRLFTTSLATLSNDHLPLHRLPPLVLMGIRFANTLGLIRKECPLVP